MSSVTCATCSNQCVTTVSYSQWNNWYCSKKCHRKERELREASRKLAEDAAEEERKKHPYRHTGRGDDVGGPGMA